MDACFWLFEPRKFKTLSKNNAEVDATDGLYIFPSAYRGRITSLCTLYGCIYILIVGICTASLIARLS